MLARFPLSGQHPWVASLNNPPIEEIQEATCDQNETISATDKSTAKTLDEVPIPIIPSTLQHIPPTNSIPSTYSLICSWSHFYTGNLDETATKLYKVEIENCH
jgi:hypothetical protein